MNDFLKNFIIDDKKYINLVIFMKNLVVYYSRTNVTKTLGDEIAKRLNADTEEIKMQSVKK